MKCICIIYETVNLLITEPLVLYILFTLLRGYHCKSINTPIINGSTLKFVTFTINSILVLYLIGDCDLKLTSAGFNRKKYFMPRMALLTSMKQLCNFF